VRNSLPEEYAMQRFSFVVLTTLLLLVMFSIGCQNDHEERILELETEHVAKIDLLEQELIDVRWTLARNEQLTDALFYKVICAGEHYHTGGGGRADDNNPLNVALVYSDGETGTLYDLQMAGFNPPYREVFRHLVCDGVSGGMLESQWSEEKFDPDVHPIQDLTLTNAILVDHLCYSNFFSATEDVVLKYVNEEILAAPGLAQRIYAMCDTHGRYMNNHIMEGKLSLRAFKDFWQFHALDARVNPPEKTRRGFMKELENMSEE